MKIASFSFLVCSSLLLGACDKDKQNDEVQKSEMAAAAKTQSPVGRYQIVFSPHMRADTYLIDTVKGRVWQMTKFGDIPGQPTAWNEIEILDSTGEIGMKYEEFRKIYGETDKPKLNLDDFPRSKK